MELTQFQNFANDSKNLVNSRYDDTLASYAGLSPETVAAALLDDGSGRDRLEVGSPEWQKIYDERLAKAQTPEGRTALGKADLDSQKSGVKEQYEFSLTHPGGYDGGDWMDHFMQTAMPLIVGGIFTGGLASAAGAGAGVEAGAAAGDLGTSIGGVSQGVVDTGLGGWVPETVTAGAGGDVGLGTAAGGTGGLTAAAGGGGAGAGAGLGSSIGEITPGAIDSGLGGWTPEVVNGGGGAAAGGGGALSTVGDSPLQVPDEFIDNATNAYNNANPGTLTPGDFSKPPTTIKDIWGDVKNANSALNAIKNIGALTNAGNAAAGTAPPRGVGTTMPAGTGGLSQVLKPTSIAKQSYHDWQDYVAPGAGT